MDGFQGAGYIDPVTGQWVSTPGTTINSGPQRMVNTPSSSSGQPAYADPNAPSFNPEFATPQGGSLTTTTPNSRTGAPAPGIRNVPATLDESWKTRPYGGHSTNYGPEIGTGLSTWINLNNAPTTDQELYDNANRTANAVDTNPLVDWGIRHGLLSPSPRWGPVTQTGPGRAPSRPVPPLPPDLPPPPPSQPGDERPPPIPPQVPSATIPTFNVPPPTTPLPPRRPRGALSSPAGGGGSAAAAPGRIAPADVNLGHYRASVGNARGSTWVPGGEDSPAPQIFRGPLTMFGAGPERGNFQNYYTPGSAPLAPGDWGWPVAPTQRQTGNARGGGGYNVEGIFQNLPANTFNSAGRRAAISPRMRAQVPGQAPGPMDPTILAGGPGARMRQQGPVDPSIIAHMRMLFGGQNPGDVGGYGGGQ